ncbi:TRAP transporter permease [Brevibacillus humidisoli]|uniref:TRAP transporter permease n=1 Tax=Brevibacillus humidisoli TaxID=2895522 RepID=UPI001E64ACD8|nr:TRAP transporter permease [Brevibacillus humidisoli]UFJ39977.1 TRAP transporter permease [Brevibacillus humidisoli]
MGDPIRSFTEQQSSENKAMAMLQKYDKESAFRVFHNKWLRLMISVITVAFAFYHFYTTYSPIVTLKHRSLHVAIILCLIFLLYPGRKRSSRGKLSLVDTVLGLLSLSTAGYIFIYYLDIVNRGGLPSAWDVIFGALLCVLVLEASRRVAGWELTAMAAVSVAYAYLGPYLPGDFGHRGYTFSDIFNYMYVTTEGVYGTAIAVSASYIILFIIFGAFLSKSGMGALFNDLSLALAGSSKGGPAKVGVIASAVHGSINGSAVASVVTTGAFTIPMMKRVGYKPDFAAGVEATAAVGGQILPPVMGAAAFIMAETLGMSYITIAIAAFIPAMLYYFGLLVQVHLRADKEKLEGLRKDELPRVIEVLKERGHLLLPLIILVALLVLGYTPTLVAVCTIAATIVIASFRRTSRMSIRDILQALENGVRDTLGVAAACAAVGITVGVFSLTGFGLKLANIILVLGQGSLFLTLVFTMVASIILGLGLPSIPCYIITATMAAPALAAFGVDPLSAHLFVFYFGVIANLTPPIALAAFAGAGIAGSDPQRTGWVSCKLALAGFVVPFIFIYKPAMLIHQAGAIDILLVTVASVLAIIALAAATEGYIFAELNWFTRLLLIAAGVVMMFPEYWAVGLSITVIVCVFAYQFLLKKRSTVISA